MRTAIFLSAALLATPALAQDVPIESDAVMSDQLSGGVISPAVQLIRGHGWRCDSISAMQPFLMSRGFSLTCNRFSYKYNFEDKGGNWVVSLD